MPLFPLCTRRCYKPTGNATQPSAMCPHELYAGEYSKPRTNAVQARRSHYPSVPQPSPGQHIPSFRESAVLRRSSKVKPQTTTPCLSSANQAADAQAIYSQRREDDGKQHGNHASRTH